MSDIFDDEKPEKNTDSESLVVYGLMSTENGREWVYKHLQDCGVFENIYDADTHKHAYSAGKRQAGLHIESDLKSHAPAYYLKMIEEQING
jgi:hypothetical protein